MPAARKPVQGADRLVAFLVAAAAKVSARGTPVWLNGAPGGRIDVGGTLTAAVGLTVADGRITRIYAISSPEKLARLDAEAALTR
jgi:RNA polymerase sigma-70 factor (ECF subfamily)